MGADIRQEPKLAANWSQELNDRFSRFGLFGPPGFSVDV
jgi:hypothetical protein